MYDMNSFPVKGGKNVCCSATFGLYLIMLTIQLVGNDRYQNKI